MAKIIEANCSFMEEHYSFTLNIGNFNLMPFMKDHPVSGPTLSLGKESDSSWQLLMIKVKDKGVKRLGFRLFKTEDNDSWDICQYTLYLKSKDGEKCIKCIDCMTVGSEDDEEYMYCEIKKDEAKELSEENLPLAEDSHLKTNNQAELQSKFEIKPGKSDLDLIFEWKNLIVVCDITYVYLIERSDNKQQDPPELRLAHDLDQLYRSQKFSDVILRADASEFHVHSNILCARSSGFDRLLQEKVGCLGRKKELRLHVSKSVAELMLVYIYTGDLPPYFEAEECYKLYTAARKYGVNYLADLCAKVLRLKPRSDPICNDCYEDEGIPLISMNDGINSLEARGIYGYESLGV